MVSLQIAMGRSAHRSQRRSLATHDVEERGHPGLGVGEPGASVPAGEAHTAMPYVVARRLLSGG